MASPIENRPAPYVMHDRLAIYRFGNGEPVLFMPGPHRFEQPGLRMADAIIAGLVGLGRQVITFDAPASGFSTRPAHLSMREMHECATEALDVCEVTGPADAFGHSMGGLCVLAYAIEHSERVRRLVLVGTGSGGPAYMKAPDAQWNRTHPAFGRMALLGMLHILWPRLGPQRTLMNLIQRESFCDKSFVEPDPLSLRDWLRPRSGRTDWYRIASKLDYSPRLGEIRAPTLVLCGRHDPQYPPSCSEELVSGIPGAHAVYIERSGHYPFVEEAEALWDTVEQFLLDEDTQALQESVDRVDLEEAREALAKVEEEGTISWEQIKKDLDL